MSTYTKQQFEHGRHVTPQDSELPVEHGHGHDDHGHDDHGGHAESTLGGYAMGFILSVILTAIPFWIVMAKVFDNSHTTSLVILGFAAVQIVVHMVYFLHMNSRSEGGWSMLAMIFTIIVVVITLSGSLWVMFHMNANMMPVSAHDMKNMP
ncbi:cytochrome o ubiquinol oxidase subunit IV [Xylophilus rhododendri]|uniref:Cytochrome bo(3) ubiquinol oxidase subunit 4 n=1 Tax=Xylophilus rhododendri TaxID=2697032 RepID=A0A857IYX9_9BURK|nr:cytochrome o ubiquinol oxidase subunit IV [Xylophilus rhododendri]QHI96656.1 cytochrome o ubiquinol oxidase subunit IV [Xylophilus rhododendri]